MKVLLASLLAIGFAEVSHTVLNNGVRMPMLAVQPEKYAPEDIGPIVSLALQTGITAVDAATFEQCQLRVGAALKKVPRGSYFLTAGIMLEQNISSSSAYATAANLLQRALTNLGVHHVDMMVLSRPATTCDSIQEQWRALEDFYAAGNARAIGLRVFCPASLKCIMETAKVVPALNQIFYHVGMGVDPEGFKSTFNESGTVTQSIRALDSGELISGKLVNSVGKAHGWSGAQVSMRWVLDRGVSLSTPMSKQSHMKEALAVFQGRLTSADLAQLDNATSPKDCPVFCPSSKMCPPLEEITLV